MRCALAYFIIAALVGLVLRYGQIDGLPEWLDFRNLRHTHSHVALLGWLHAGIYILIVAFYNLERPVYTRIYWVSQICVLGMLLSFPVQGYKAFSIIFLVAFILLTYVFIYMTYRDLRKGTGDYSRPFLYASLFFLFLSSLGTWSLGIMNGTGHQGTPLFYGAIQFYLHFQFNGWLIFGVIALFLKFLQLRNIEVDMKKLRTFYILLIIATFLTFALAISWSTPLKSVFLLNSVGVVIQMIALIYFFSIIKNVKRILKSELGNVAIRLFYLAGLSFIFKVFIQTFVTIPTIAVISYTIRNFVIGFIHLLMLGCISLILAGFIETETNRDKAFPKGLIVFIVGIVLSELVLFLQGLGLWLGLGFLEYYYEIAFAVSALLPLGLMMWYFGMRKSIMELSISPKNPPV